MDETPVLGILGPAGSGKDLVGDWFCNTKQFQKVAFADPIKRFASKCFDLDDQVLWGPSELRNQEFEIGQEWWLSKIPNLTVAAKEIINDVLEVGYRTTGFLSLFEWMTKLRTDFPEKISARVILQTLGTEWGRSVDPIMWVKYAHRVIDTIKTEKRCYSQPQGLLDTELANDYKGIIIPDFRFLNEVEYSQAHGTHVIRLRRLALEPKEIGITGHQSEAEQKTIPDSAFHLVLEFPEGVDKVHEILEDTYQKKAWSRS